MSVQVQAPSASSASAAGVCQGPVEDVIAEDGSWQSAVEDRGRARQTHGQRSQSSGEVGTKMI